MTPDPINRAIDNRMRRMLTEEAATFTAPTLSRYLTDPAYRARLDAERAQRQAEIGAPFEAHDRARQQSAWARDEAESIAEAPPRNMIPMGGTL